ncbi:hypothetical protein [Vibrio maritimus]|uniref:hypothetical protein n=1 Tax=Vibrio maritimus TaxID=990268 RepID=UPI001F22EDA5|nr:hypothetical protein [Vibrio maritimus]
MVNLKTILATAIAAVVLTGCKTDENGNIIPPDMPGISPAPEAMVDPAYVINTDTNHTNEDGVFYFQVPAERTDGFGESVFGKPVYIYVPSYEVEEILVREMNEPVYRVQNCDVAKPAECHPYASSGWYVNIYIDSNGHKKRIDMHHDGFYSLWDSEAREYIQTRISWDEVLELVTENAFVRTDYIERLDGLRMVRGNYFFRSSGPNEVTPEEVFRISDYQPQG